MKPRYLFSSGYLERKNNTISFINESEGRKYIPIENLSEMYVFGEVDLNKRVLEFLTEKGITIHFFNHYGYYVGSYYPREHYNSSYVLTRQVEKYLNQAERLKIAKKFLIGATKNMLRNIKEYSEKIQRLPDFELSIETFFRKILDAENIEQLMGVEATSDKRIMRPLI